MKQNFQTINGQIGYKFFNKMLINNFYFVIFNEFMSKYNISIFKVVVLVLIIFTILLFISRIVVLLSSHSSIIPIERVTYSRIAIVFGAGLRRDKSPSPVLKDRILTAVDLYNAGIVEKILMTGDNRFDNYDEPTAMAIYAIENSIPNEDIILDFAGHSTYDSCYRALNIFNVKQAILVTQSFHLPRAIFICKQLGLDSVGVASDRRQYSLSSLLFWHLREIPASAAAILDVWMIKPLRCVGDSKPIITDQSEK